MAVEPSFDNPLGDQTLPEQEPNLLDQQLKAPDPSDYLSNFDAETVLHDPAFLADTRKYFEDRDGSAPADDDDLRSKFFSDITFKRMNTVGLATDWANSQSQTNDQNAREGRLQQVYQKLPDFWQRGGRGFQGLAQNLLAMGSDPINLIPFGEIAKIAQGVRVATAAAEAGRGAITAGLAQAAASGGREAAIMGGFGAVQDAASQERDIALGMQSDVDWSQVASSAAMQAAIAGGPVALAGLVRGTKAGRAIARSVELWPAARGGEVAKLNELLRNADAHTAASEPEIAASFTAAAEKQKAAIDRWDQLARNRGKTDQELGITPAEEPGIEGGEEPSGPTVDPVEAANTETLKKLRDKYAGGMPNPHLDPNVGDNLVYRTNLSNIEWSINYDENIKRIADQIAQIQAKPKPTAADGEVINNLRTQMTMRKAIRDRLLTGEPKDEVQMEQALREQGVPPQPNEGYGVNKYTQPIPEGAYATLPARAEGPAAVQPAPGATPGAPAPTPTAPIAGPEAPLPAASSAGPAAPTAPEPAPAPAAGGGGGGGGGGAATAATPAAEPPPAAAVAETAAASAPAAEPAATPAATTPKGKATKQPTAPIWTPGPDYQVVPTGTVLPPGLQVETDMTTGVTRARLMPHAVTTAAGEVVAKSAATPDPNLVALMSDVEGTLAYKYGGKSEAGKLSMTEVLQEAGYDGDETDAIVAQIKEKSKGLGSQRATKLQQREMLGEAIVYKQLERMADTLEASGRDVSPDVLMDLVDKQTDDPKTAAIAMRVLDGRSHLQFAAHEDTAGGFAEEFMRDSVEAKARGTGDTDPEGGPMSREQKGIFKTVARKRAEKMLAQMTLPLDMQGRFHGEAMHFADIFVNSDYVPGSHEARLATFDQFLGELRKRYEEIQSGTTTGPTSRALGERGASAGGEARFGNPDEIYKKNPLRPDKRAGLPSILKKSNKAGFIGRGLGKADIGTVGEARALAQRDKWRDVKKLTLKERYKTADGKDLKPGDVVFYNPITDKAYADPMRAALRQRSEPGTPPPTGGENVIPAVPSSRETAEAQAAGVDPVKYATRLRDLEPRKVRSKDELESAGGKTISAGAEHFKAKDGSVYRDMAEFRKAQADAVKKELPPEEGAAPVAPAPTPSPTPPAGGISQMAKDMAAETGGDPVAIQAFLEAHGLLPEGPVPAAEVPPDLPAGVEVPENWAPQPGRKLALRSKRNGSVRASNPAQSTAEELIGPGTTLDQWEVGSVKNDISSGQQGSAQADFIRAGEEPTPPTAPEDVTAVPKTSDPGEMLTIDDASQMPLAEPIMVVDPITGDIKPVKTALDGAKALRALHSVKSWPKTRVAMRSLIDQIEALTKGVPKVKRPSVDRAEARASIRTLFEKLAPEELPLALDAIRRIPGVDLPEFMDKAGSSSLSRGGYTAFGGLDSNGEWVESGIKLSDPANFDEEYPLITILHHELGHWGYDNILTDEDRLTYMRWAHDTFYDKNGRFDQALVDRVAPTKNNTYSPQEMFASLFQRYVVTNGKALPMPVSLMQKFATYLSKFIERFMGKSTNIDRQVEPLFAKIMPDPVADSWLKTLGSEGTTKEGQQIVASVRILDKARHMVETGLTTGSAETIEQGIRNAMDAVNRGAETFGREKTDALRTRLGNIVRESAAVQEGHDPSLDSLRASLLAKGIDPVKAWNALSEADQRVLKNNFVAQTLVAIGDKVDLGEKGEHTVYGFEGGDPNNPTYTLRRVVSSGYEDEKFTRNQLAQEAGVRVVPEDQRDITKLMLTENPGDPALAAIKAANEAHEVLSDAFAQHEEAFGEAEAGAPMLRVENPMDLTSEPLPGVSTYATGNYLKLNEAARLLEAAKSTTDAMAVEHLVEAADEIARVTGRSGFSKKTGKAGDWFGGVQFQVWRYTNKEHRRIGRDIVDAIYEMFTDFNAQAEAEHGFVGGARRVGATDTGEAVGEVQPYSKNVTTTFGTMTEAQRAHYDDLIKRAQAFVPALMSEMTRIRKWADVETAANIAKGTFKVSEKVANDVKKVMRGKRIAKAAAGKRPRGTDEVRGVGGQTPDMPSPKSLSPTELVDAIIEHGARTKPGLSYGAELNARDKTVPFLPHVKAEQIPNDVVQAGTAELGVMLKAAIAEGDKKTADHVRWEAFRRAKNNLKKRGITDPEDLDVVASIERELRQTEGEPDNVGVPEGAPAMIKDLLSRFTHRKPDVQTSLRTTMYRLFNLGGLTDSATRDGLTVGRLFRLAGREVPEHMDPASTVFDIREPAFSEVRSAMRKLVGNFAEGKGDPGENISNMLEMVLRSGLLDDHEYGAIHDAYGLTYDSIKKGLEGSHVVPPARRPDAWFADHVTDYLMGDKGTADLFKPDKNMEAPGFRETLAQIKTTAERVKDATAYVVNGLLHENMRRDFPTLTDYGDVFEQPRLDQLETNQAPSGMEEQGMLNANAMNEDAPRLNAILIGSFMTDTDHEMAHMPRAAGLLADAAEKGGAGPRPLKIVAAGADGLKKLGGLREAGRYNFGHIYKRTSDLVRGYGMKWWGDKLNPLAGVGIYHKIQVQGADYIMPLINMGHAMSDAPGALKGWWNRNKFWQEGMQPQTHANVTEVLRGMKSYSSLTAEEQRLHNAYRAMFTRVKKELDAAGVQVGDAGEYYFPQVFDPEKILKNRDAAINAWASYLVEESGSPTSVLQTRLSVEEARQKAADIIDGITNEDGVYMPPKAERRSSKADSIDYQRMFRLNEIKTHPVTGRKLYNADGSPQMRYARSYALMKPFMQSGLEPVTVKYMEAAARRIVTTKELGVNAHMFHDYMHIMQGGPDQAIVRGTDLLATKKVVRHNFLDRADDGGFEEATRTIETYHNMTGHVAQYALEDGIKAMGDGKTEADIQRGVEAILAHSVDKGQTAINRFDAVMHGIADAKNREGQGAGKPLSADEYRRAEGAYRVALQKSVGAQSNIARKTKRTLLNFNSLTMLGWTTLSSTPDLFYPLIRSGNLGATLRAWASYASDRSYRDAMRNTGAVIEQLTHDRIGMLHGGQGSKLTRAFFNFNMLTHWDSFVREIGSAVGWEALKAEQARALRAGKGTRAWRQAEARLGRYGLAHYLERDANGRMRSLNDPRLLNIEGGDPELRQGIVKFVNECVFSHTPDDVPLWAQTPLGKLAFQLKAFPTMMGRMALGRDGVMHQFGKWAMGRDDGNPMPLIYMLTIGTGGALGSNMLKDIVQGRGGATHDKHALQDRRMSEIAKQFGWKLNIHGPADQFLGNYAESFMMLGGLGFLSDLLYQAGQAADNGTFGYQRMIGAVFGPTAGLAQTGWEGVATGLYPSKANMRQLTSDVVQKIPIFGGNRSVKNYLTNQIAGPAAPKGGASGWVAP